VYIIEQLLSPIVTPFLLLFWLRPRSADIVDFFRNFTVDVVGVGDVCSFSQMDTQRHGNTKVRVDMISGINVSGLKTTWFFKWLSRTKVKPKFQAKNGKTELSLIHFSHTNPRWKMPKEATDFMDKIKEHALSETTTSTTDNEHSLSKSLYQLQSVVLSSNAQPSLAGFLLF
jgi:autophagy-related protein 9